MNPKHEFKRTFTSEDYEFLKKHGQRSWLHPDGRPNWTLGPYHEMNLRDLNEVLSALYDMEDIPKKPIQSKVSEEELQGMVARADTLDEMLSNHNGECPPVCEAGWDVADDVRILIAEVEASHAREAELVAEIEMLRQRVDITTRLR